MIGAPQDKCHPQTIAVCQTRAEGLGLEAVVSSEAAFEYGKDVCGVLLQYPTTDGTIDDYKVGPACGSPAPVARWGAGVWTGALF
jgi:glycine dehydrogenase